MSRRRKKPSNSKLEKIRLIVGILGGLATIICRIYDSFFKG